MKKVLLKSGLIAAMAMALCVTAYAEGTKNCPLTGFCQSVGGFLYNALPWNWGNWMGK